MKRTRKRVMSILLVLFMLIGSVPGVTLTAYAATAVSDEAELIAALGAGGDIELANDIEMVGSDRITVAQDATIDLKNNTLKFSTTTYNPLGVDAGKTLEFKGPGTVEFVSTFGSTIKGELVVSGGAELKLASVDLGSGALTVTGSGSKISSGFFNGSGSLTITENAAMECTGDRLSCKNIKISGGASVKAKTIYSNSRGGSVVITGTGTTVEGYDTNSVTIGGSNANSSSSISISSGATVNNANYIGHYGAVTIDGAAINGRENGCIVTGSPLTVKGSSGLNNVSSLQDNVTIADNSNVTFLNTSGETFKSIRKLTFTGTPTLNNMGKVSCNYTCEGIYLYQDAGAVFNLQDGLTGLDVSFGTGSEAMIYIKDQRSGLLPGIVRYDGDTLPRDIAVYEGTLQRDTADFTSYCQDEQVSTLESGTDKLRMAAPVCKIERNGSTIEYYTVQEAFSDAKKGETIVMIRDAICGDSIVLDPQTSNGVTEYTLDLAGFGIGQESSLPYDNDHIPFVVHSGMTLNLTDSSDKQTGYISVYDYEYPLFFNAGTINIDRGTYFGVICGASFNGADLDDQAENYQSIGSDGTYVFKEAYIIHAKDVQSKDEYDNNYSIDELSYITIAENYGIDEDFEPGYSPSDHYVRTHIKKITYFVTFDANGGDGSMEKQEIDPNTPTALNANTFALTGSAFTGWNTEADGSGTAYADKAEVTLDADVTLYAQWEENQTEPITPEEPETTGDLVGEVVEPDPADPTKEIYTTGAAITVTNWKGVEITGITTDLEGKFTVDDLEEGDYNVIAEKDGVKATVIVTIIGGATNTIKITMPEAEKNSVLDNSKAGAYAPVVGGLDTIAQKETIPSDATKLTITLTVTDESNIPAEKKAQFDDEVAQIEALDEAQDQTIIPLDLKLEKTIIGGAEAGTTDIGGTNDEILTIIIPFDSTDKENVTVYRFHSGDQKAEVMKASSSNANEGFKVSDDSITVFAKRFSTYAIGYDNKVTPSPTPSTGGGTSGYDVTVKPAENGTVEADKKTAEKDETVTITVKPDNGYKLDTLKVTAEDGTEVEVTKNADGSYSYKQPAGKTTVETTFKLAFVSPDVTGVSDMLITDDHIVYISGYPDGTVRPEGNITRAEVATMFYKLLKDKDVEAVKTFSDVSDDAWYAPYVGVLAAKGIISGYTDGTFRPDQKITRAEFAVVATLFAKEAAGSKTFSDVPDNFWAKGNIATAAEYGWVTGYPNGTFAPQGYITRGETATIVNLMLGRVADTEYIDAHLSELKQFSDLQNAEKWYFYNMHEAINEHDFTMDGAIESWK